MNAANGSVDQLKPQQVVGSYATYAQAEQAVDYLSDHDFPVQHTAIVGRGLESVEQVTGRLTFLTAAGRGAAAGAAVGALFGWLFGLFGWIAPLLTDLLLALFGALYGAVLGALIGAGLGLLGHALSRGRRDFTSRQVFRARSHDLLVDCEVASGATNLLQSAGAPGLGRPSAQR
ncbi:general stress protein [Amycolatopsis suaedae]|uniref:Glycine zipper family protein n=1 Tax=Amycolatopsis suaedae TaxID=2510978 RepID=A0A4Q7JBT3_9PSEU|nr:general stress protein [Amycolatopsis suaedae]RZQ64558.1 glycine zipper family protein [Amycolatopsis suaedae]